MANKSQRKHHKKEDFCYSRPSYREGRWERAVKVYTINQESKYLLIQGVPSVGICKELIELCALYGAVEEYRFLDEYPSEEFTDVYWIKFQRIQSARFAKKKLDNRSFFGGILHVCYAPEYENIADTREKLQERRKLIAKKYKEQDNLLKSAATESNKNNKVQTVVQTESDSNKSVTNKQEYDDMPIQSNTDIVNVPCTDQDSVSFQKTSEPVNLLENKQYPHETATYPILPLPPVEFDNFYSPPPLPTYEYPWVPTKHATLPPEPNWSSINPSKSVATASSNSSNNSYTVPVKCGSAGSFSAERNNLSKQGTVGLSNSTSQPLKREGESQIVFRQHDSQLITHDIGDSEPLNNNQIQIPEPSAWDPYYDVRKQANSYTGDNSLDNLSVTIKQKLSKVSEPRIEPNISLYDIDGEQSFEHLSPTKKKARKRI